MGADNRHVLNPVAGIAGSDASALSLRCVRRSFSETGFSICRDHAFPCKVGVCFMRSSW